MDWLGIAGAVRDVVLDDAVRHQRPTDRPGVHVEGLSHGQSRRYRRLHQRLRRLATPGVDLDAQFTAPLLRPDL